MAVPLPRMLPETLDRGLLTKTQEIDDVSQGRHCDAVIETST